MTKFLRTTDGKLISERYIVSINIRLHGLPDAYITFQERSNHFGQTTAKAADAEAFLKEQT